MTTILIAELVALGAVSLLGLISYSDFSWRKEPKPLLCRVDGASDD